MSVEPGTASLTLRLGRDEDAAGFIALICACWAEYPGCVLDVDGEVPELRRLASHYAAKGGAVWVAEDRGSVAGMVCAAPRDEKAWEIGRMYVARPHRGTGLAHRLLDQAEAHAVAQGARRIELWSDTRFDAAHRFYEKRSYVRAGPIRPLNDLSHSLEFHYAKPIAGLAIQELDVAAAASAGRRLTDILIACVDAGASLPFPAPLPVETARACWRGVAADLASGATVLLAAWMDGMLAGTVQVQLPAPPNQPHRAAVRMLLVDPPWRRRGIARALAGQAEQAALRRNRWMLTTETRAGDPAETLFRAPGWREAGRIPEDTLDASAKPHGTLIFWKKLLAS
jgi:GNAT superfamily N-acetyltransferase